MTPNTGHQGETDVPPFLHRVVLRNYRSIAACDVRLGNLTFLVGPNGSGKSNFLDTLRFVSDALRNSLDYAVRERGGVDEVIRRTAGQDDRFGIRLDFYLPTVGQGHYAFSIRAHSSGGYTVEQEECIVEGAEGPGIPRSFFHIQDGAIHTSIRHVPPAVFGDRLYLTTASGLPEFRPVYDGLSQMGFYNIIPDRVRDFQSPDAGGLLARDGSNITTILRHMFERYMEARLRVEQYLAAIVPGVRQVHVTDFGTRQGLEFVQRPPEGFSPRWHFPASSMSDGTLRALGILVALFQGGIDGNSTTSLIGIEEPEAALHPAAVGVLLDALQEASAHTQVIATSHSPDLLDSDVIRSENILAVSMEEGKTIVGPIDDVSRSILRDHLYSAGELMRQSQLRPDERAVLAGEQARLFDDDAHAW